MEQARHMASMACGRRTVDDGAGAGVAQAQAIGDQMLTDLQLHEATM
jgi:hypothetical protein